MNSTTIKAKIKTPPIKREENEKVDNQESIYNYLDVAKYFHLL